MSINQYDFFTHTKSPLCTLIIIQIRRYFFPYHFMICIQHFFLTAGHLIRIDSIPIDRSISNIFKLHELTIFVFLCFHADQLILGTDAVLTFQIYTRLVRSDHTLFQSAAVIALCNDSPTEAVRSLMYIQDMSDTMSGSAFIINPHLP